MSVLNINISSILKNLKSVKKLCESRGCGLVPVTKICLSDPVIVKSFKDRGVDIIADSSLDNFNHLETDIRRFLLKIRLNEARSGDLNCDFIYTSGMDVIKALSERADHKNYRIFLALELGDLREGILPEELPEIVDTALKLPNISIAGLSANFGCLMGKLPDQDVSAVLKNTLSSVKRRTGFEFEFVSFGGTAVYPALVNDILPDEVNQIRIGEAIFFGYNLIENKPIQGLIDDAFILSGEILEIREKNLDSRGSYGYNAFGEKTINKDSGYHKRAVLDFGKLGAPVKEIIPKDSGVRTTGSTHDYTVVDISESKKKYCVGGPVDFILNYNSAAQAYISPQIINRFC